MPILHLGVLAVMLLAASVAKADFIYQFSGSDGNGYSINLQFTRATLASSGTEQTANFDFSSVIIPNWSNVVVNGFNWFGSSLGATPGSCLGLPEFQGNGCVEIGFFGLLNGNDSTAADAILFPDKSFNSTGTFTSNDGLFTFSIREATVVPEPASLALLGTGILALAGFVRRRR